jgi:hypothetical protein
MFLTDCVVTSPNKIKEIKKIINGNGYECKQKSVIFTKIDKQNKIIYWHDFDEINKKTLAKGVDKYYHYSENQVINNK